MRTLADRFARDDRGATAIEYGLMAALLALAVIASLGLIIPVIKDSYGGIADKFPDVPGGS